MRKQFPLPEDDIIFLESQGMEWETVNNQGMHWVILYNYPVPPGYQIDKTTVAIKIETGYPRTGLDMAYFYPPLAREDGQPIGAVVQQQIDGLSFQRWSRHRTVVNPWREGVDDLSTHLSLVNFWFEQEFIKRANAITT
ncbi:E2/UBC family protein [Mucilaginibacter sp. OK098]|uniref:E2/UBC family protein n=1 Tax=Mucilaginibacter sp. OK098 TaxID=1855297 RepID=UPI00092487E4|nr:E2/UBC family protein [Mucilaginibacter sp. OK098]SHN32848.1 E2 family protein E [Mucilaginibacter sp. OK098]